jgi:hypothetical protein
MTYQLRYGSYTFPRGMYPADDSSPVIVPASKHPRTDGARLLAPTLAEKRIIVKGGIVAASGTALRSTVDALKAAVLQGPANLTFQSDRYWRAVVCRDLKIQHPGTWYDRIAEIECDFTTGDPFQYDTTSNTVNLTVVSSGNSTVATAGGNAYARPVISVTAGAANIAATVYNDTTGEAFTLIGTCSNGDVVAVDTLNEAVAIAGVDRTDLFDGLFPRLAVGANTLRVTYISSSISNLSIVWQNRWY